MPIDSRVVRIPCIIVLGVASPEEDVVVAARKGGICVPIA